MTRSNLVVKGCSRIHLGTYTSTACIRARHDVPFEIRRVYYLYGVPSGASRAGHAHFALEQLLIPVSGSFEVLLDDGRSREVVNLQPGEDALLIRSCVWREIHQFSAEAVCLVLASEHYDESDYIRDYRVFLRHVHGDDSDSRVSVVEQSGTGQFTRD